MISQETLGGVLRTLAASLQTPVMLILIFLVGLTVFLAGTLVTEIFLERIHFKVNLRQLIGDINKKENKLEETIKESRLLNRQKRLLVDLMHSKELSGGLRESWARKLLQGEQSRYDKITGVSDVIARLAPMLGLLGTLIPLGPGLIAMGQGDTYTISTSLLIAFDTTVAGLVSGAAAFLISLVRKRMYEDYMEVLETVAEGILEMEGV